MRKTDLVAEQMDTALPCVSTIQFRVRLLRKVMNKIVLKFFFI